MALSPVTDLCLSPSCHVDLVTQTGELGGRAVSAGSCPPPDLTVTALPTCSGVFVPTCSAGASWCSVNSTLSFRKPAVTVGRSAVPCPRSPRLSLRVHKARPVSVTVHIVICFSSLVACASPTCQLRRGWSSAQARAKSSTRGKGSLALPGATSRWERSHCPGLCDL